MTHPLSTATIALNGTFTAAELEQLIAELIQTRASLSPPVAQDPPSQWDANALHQRATSFRIRTLVDGGLRIWLRNEGIGWIAFDIPHALRRELVEFLSKQPGHTHTMQ